jgi:hypothetical protein
MPSRPFFPASERFDRGWFLRPSDRSKELKLKRAIVGAQAYEICARIIIEKKMTRKT